MATTVYVLCALTSLVCAVLLWRGYRVSRARLLLLSSAAFWCFVANNVLLIVDLRILPAVDLVLWRALPALLGILILLVALVWESER